MAEGSRLFQTIVGLPADAVEMALLPAAQAGRRRTALMPGTGHGLPHMGCQADRWIRKQSYKLLHISMAQATTRTHPADIASDEMRNHFQQMLELGGKDFSNLEKRLVSEGLAAAWSPRASHPFGEPALGHDITIPNIMALQGVGKAFENAGPRAGSSLLSSTKDSLA